MCATCAALGSRLTCVSSGLSAAFSLATQEMARLDVLKVFLGRLNADCFKPKIIRALELEGLHAQDVFVPEIKPGCLGIAFCTFLTEAEAQRCITAFNGCSTVDLTPSAVQAGRTTTWEPFLFLFFRF